MYNYLIRNYISDKKYLNRKTKIIIQNNKIGEKSRGNKCIKK